MADFEVRDTVHNVQRVECDQDGDEWTCDVFDENSTDTDAPPEAQDPATTIQVEDVEVFDGKKSRGSANIDEVLTSGDYDVSYYFYGDMACQHLGGSGSGDLFCTGRYSLKDE